MARIRRLILTLTVAAVLATPAQAATLTVLKAREQRQQMTLHANQSTLRFFRHHRWLTRGRTRPIALREIRRATIWVRVTRRELAETRAALRPRPAVSSYPAGWLAQAACIRAHEGAWTSATGNGYYGAYQFLLSTWQSVGGVGYPHQASPDEQTRTHTMNALRDGGSWAEWGTAGMCGLR